MARPVPLQCSHCGALVAPCEAGPQDAHPSAPRLLLAPPARRCRRPLAPLAASAIVIALGAARLPSPAAGYHSTPPVARGQLGAQPMLPPSPLPLHAVLLVIACVLVVGLSLILPSLVGPLALATLHGPLAAFLAVNIFL